MAYLGYVLNSGPVALVAEAPKTVLGVKATGGAGGDHFGLHVKDFSLAFDGVSPDAPPVYVEFNWCSWSTNSPNINSTVIYPTQIYGRKIAAGAWGGKNWTAEPTSQIPLKQLYVTPDKGTWLHEFPLGMEPDAEPAWGFAIRLTAPEAVSVTACMTVERI